MHDSALYVSIYNKILLDIKNGKYLENAPLPSERVLCDKYHVSRSTIRKALHLLKDSEAVYSVQGNGTFIKPQVFTQPLTYFYSFTDTLKRSNVLIQNEIIQYEQITADVRMAKKTGYPLASRFHKIVRLRGAKDYPLMLETTYLPCARFIRLDLDELAKGSLYEYLKKNYGFIADNAIETLRPIMPYPDEKALLKIPSNTPCMLLERFSYEAGLLIEYTKSVIRGDKYIFHIDLKRINQSSSEDGS